MKTISKILLLCFFVTIPFTVFSQGPKEEKLFIPDKTYFWEKPQQRYTIKKCELYSLIYAELEPENTYIKYIPTKNEDEYILEINNFSTQARPKRIDVTQSIIIPSDGSSPISSKSQNEHATKTLLFKYMNQKENVKSGDVVNIIYEGVSPDKTYISYSSTETGYELELYPLYDQKVLNFDKRCQSFIVASPATTTIQYSDEVRFEQIVWTPRVDGSWEVRLGTREQGCKSDAFERIKELRTREYLNSVPIERKNVK